ncbi:MAG: hypothetical protein AB7N61_22620 [Acidimicrobiia bacterium]
MLGAALFDAFTLGSYSEVAVIAVIMTDVTLAGLVVALVLGGRNVLSRL